MKKKVRERRVDLRTLIDEKKQCRFMLGLGRKASNLGKVHRNVAQGGSIDAGLRLEK